MSSDVFFCMLLHVTLDNDTAAASSPPSCGRAEAAASSAALGCRSRVLLTGSSMKSPRCPSSFVITHGARCGTSRTASCNAQAHPPESEARDALLGQAHHALAQVQADNASGCRQLRRQQLQLLPCRGCRRWGQQMAAGRAAGGVAGQAVPC